ASESKKRSLEGSREYAFSIHVERVATGSCHGIGGTSTLQRAAIRGRANFSSASGRVQEAAGRIAQAVRDDYVSTGAADRGAGRASGKADGYPPARTSQRKNKTGRHGVHRTDRTAGGATSG